MPYVKILLALLLFALAASLSATASAGGLSSHYHPAIKYGTEIAIVAPDRAAVCYWKGTGDPGAPTFSPAPPPAEIEYNWRCEWFRTYGAQDPVIVEIRPGHGTTPVRTFGTRWAYYSQGSNWEPMQEWVRE